MQHTYIDLNFVAFAIVALDCVTDSVTGVYLLIPPPVGAHVA
jgi:hypothetical protein